MDGPPEKKWRPRKKRCPPLGTADLILRAVSATEDRKGMSHIAMKKALAAQGYDVEAHSSQIKRSIKFLLQTGALLQLKGSGARGSYKANKKAVKSKSAAAKKPKAAKPKKAEKPEAAEKTPASKRKA